MGGNMMCGKQNIMDIYIKDLQGNYYDINWISTEGNDCMLIEIKRRDEEYVKKRGGVNHG